ncbi:hypothetical protein [Oleisolibacter albus]|uniref:hypothetical protein n=1 Tax=Oleisolibacter albus TaxID=2171757 RepID=UPI000DF3D651|nr:hypothetical protein [Oleisolibacter albus]
MAISGVNSYASYWSRMSNVAAADATASSGTASTATGTGTAAPAAADAGATAQDGGVKTTDFTQMTRKGLMDWVNSKLRSGEMSFDASTTFVSMTINGMPVDSPTAGTADTAPMNFMQALQDGIAGARQNNDQDLLQRLTAALGTMQRDQGRVSGVNLLA